MPNVKVIKSIIEEYGLTWLINRLIYSIKIKTMKMAPATEKWYEKDTQYPKRLDLFQIDVKYLKEYIKQLEYEKKQALIRMADKACEGIIIGFSSIDLNYGNPIDWQLNPLTGKRCDEKRKWYNIPDFDEERGDIKVTWEASRFSHFITLARAYLLTEDIRYYNSFSTQLEEWLSKNIYSYGANYKCSQECALRMVNTLLAYTIFKDQEVATDADTSNVKNLIDRCYRKILSNFFYSYRCIKNNHTISELMGMIVGAWCSNDHKQIDKAYSLLNKVICEQFTEDGGYCQFSFNYQRLALQDIECVLSIEEKTGKAITGEARERIKNAALLMYQCQDESGDMPNYGNNDGAMAFPVTSCGYRDFRPIINTIFALCEGKQLYQEGNHQEELIWFSGGRKFQEYPKEKKERISTRFEKGGLFTLREKHSWAMVVSTDYRTRPGHMDQHHLDLWMNNVNVLCDAGTYSYASDLGRKLLKNESHNTAVVNDSWQMNFREPFLIYDWTRRDLGKCDDDSFEGKIISANGYKHYRKVKKNGSSYVITDKVDKDFTILFHTICEIQQEDKGYTLKFAGENMCRIECNAYSSITTAKRSLYYLVEEDINCLLIKGKANNEIKTIITIE